MFVRKFLLVSKKITLHKQRAFYSTLFCIVSVLFLNGCVLQKHVVKMAVDHNASCSIDEARFVDLPIPLSFSLQSVSTTETGCSFVYTTTESLHDVSLFYDKEMDFYGWQKVGFVNCFVEDQQPNSCALLFERPSRFCFIYGNNQVVNVFLLFKKIETAFLQE